MKLLLFASCAVTLGVCGYTLVELQGKLDACVQERDELERENAEFLVRTLYKEAESDEANSSAEDLGPQGSSDGLSTGRVDQEGDPLRRMRAWSIERGIKEVQDVLALEGEEQERIRQALDASLERNGTSPNRDVLEKVVEDTLGPDKAAQLKAGLDQRDAQQFNQRILKDTAFYAKSLRLSSEQERMLEASLRMIELELKPRRAVLQNRMREAMSKHFGGEGAKVELQRDYDEIEALSSQIEDFRIDALLAALSDQLSDEQKNQLLEIKAKALP